MRFRLATRPPFRPLRAWFDIPNDNSVPDVYSVKTQICSRLPQLVDEDGAKSCPSDLALFINDFELLDDSSLEVIKENDLVHIVRKSTVDADRKRKLAAETRTPNSARKKRRVLSDRPPVKSRPLVESEDDSSDSDSSTSSSVSGLSTSSPSSSSSSATSSSSSSESSSDSEGSSSSDSSLSERVEVQSSKFPRTLSNGDSNLKCVPPGHGKPSTHSRNARRRLKRLYEREKKQLEQVATNAISNGSANAVPLGSKNVPTDEQTDKPAALQDQTISPSIEQSSPLEVEGMVTTLRNKNKKKGFKKAMAGAVPQKIHFTDDLSPQSASTLHSAESSTRAPPQTNALRLITPSQKQAQGLLPSNMFVTSVEVESESWDKKKKTKQRNNYGSELNDNSANYEPMTETILNYGESEVEWTSIEKSWENMKLLSDISSLKEGSVVGWKALAINPTTFTPETLVHLGRIKRVDSNISSIVVEPIRRSGSTQVAFGASVMDGESGNEDSEKSFELETYTFEDALKAPWKYVDI